MRVRFVTDPKHDFVSRAIRKAQLGRWPSHCEIETADGKGYFGAHLDGGVLIRPKGYDASYNPVEFTVAVPTTPDQDAKLWHLAAQQLGKPYDLELIGAFIDGMISGESRDWRADDHWICSEIVASLSENISAIKPFPGGTICVTPWDVFNKFSEVVDLTCAVPAAAKMLMSVEVPIAGKAT